MNCPSCGNQVEQGDSFCMHCGAALANAAQPPAAAPVRLEALPQPAPQPPAPPPAQTSPTEPAARVTEPAVLESPLGNEVEWTPAPADRPPSGSRWLGLIAVLLLLFALAAVGGYLLQRTVLREDPAQVAATVDSPSDSLPGAATAVADAQPEPQASAADAAGQDSSPGSDVPDEAASTSATASSPGATTQSPGATAPSAGAPTPKRPAAPPAPSAASLNPQAVATDPAPTPSASSSAGAIRVPSSVPAPRPEPVPSEPPKAPAATASTSGTEQPQAGSPSETTVAGTTETTGTPQGQRAPRNTRVLRPDSQQPPPQTATQQPGTTPAALQPRPAAPAPQEREEGVIYWTGRLTKNQIIVIERDKATIGLADGSLPATPVDVWLPSPVVALVERPNSSNDWNRVAFRCLRSTDRNVTLNIQWKRLR